MRRGRLLAAMGERGGCSGEGLVVVGIAAERGEKRMLVCASSALRPLFVGFTRVGQNEDLLINTGMTCCEILRNYCHGSVTSLIIHPCRNYCHGSLF
jgi:hypothetical protein